MTNCMVEHRQLQGVSVRHALVNRPQGAFGDSCDLLQGRLTKALANKEQIRSYDVVAGSFASKPAAITDDRTPWVDELLV